MCGLDGAFAEASFSLAFEHDLSHKLLKVTGGRERVAPSSSVAQHTRHRVDRVVDAHRGVSVDAGAARRAELLHRRVSEEAADQHSQAGSRGPFIDGVRLAVADHDERPNINALLMRESSTPPARRAFRSRVAAGGQRRGGGSLRPILRPTSADCGFRSARLPRHRGAGNQPRAPRPACRLATLVAPSSL